MEPSKARQKLRIHELKHSEYESDKDIQSLDVDDGDFNNWGENGETPHYAEKAHLKHFGLDACDPTLQGDSGEDA